MLFSVPARKTTGAESGRTAGEQYTPAAFTVAAGVTLRGFLGRAEKGRGEERRAHVWRVKFYTSLPAADPAF